ncbi:MAG: hypothetical protein KJ666_12815 [Bacteroidetes bacterium]|nr:hypothetical protein [Bacteroidota bacterium]MBU2584607.1 hypothetical protein [Bacteroidota bacterium]
MEKLLIAIDIIRAKYGMEIVRYGDCEIWSSGVKIWSKVLIVTKSLYMLET